jgi:flagellar biosynthesis protein FlhB
MPLPPSEKRRREARERGEVAQSSLATGAAALAAGAAAVALGGAAAGAQIAQLMRASFAGAQPPTAALADAGWLLFRLAAPVLAAAWLAAVLAGLAQTRGLFTAGAFRRRAPWPPWGEAAQGWPAWALAAALALVVAAGAARFAAALAHADTVGAATRAAGEALRTLALRAAGLFALAGVVDYLVRRARLERALEMTRAEREAERREEEGDPRLRAEQRRRHRALAGSSLVDQVARAAVVVAAEGTAAALAPSDEGDGVRVVAAAEGLGAARLVDVARRLGVPVRGDALLAAALAPLRPGDAVPPPHLARARATLRAVRR